MVVPVLLQLFGTGLILASVFIPRYIQRLLDEGIADRVTIRDESSPAFAAFKDSRQKDNPPVHLSVYLFNLTNADDVMKGALLAHCKLFSTLLHSVVLAFAFNNCCNTGAKPVFVEKGPYW